MDKDTNEYAKLLVNGNNDVLNEIYETGIKFKFHIDYYLLYNILIHKHELNPHELANLGYMYDNGKGVKVDYNKAFYYYELSAKQGNSFAQFNLGFMYEYGNGVKKCIDMAIHYFTLSALQGDKDALEHLERLYNNNYGGLIKLLNDNDELKTENEQLKKMNEQLQLQVDFQPGGNGYNIAKKDFNELANAN